MSLSLNDVQRATRMLDWTVVHDMSDGEEFGVILDGQHHTVTKLQSDPHTDSDYDRDIYVVFGLNGQFFKKTGYADVGSHCYGEYTPAWNPGLSEVRVDVRPVTYYV